jgi:hypothetical protein
MSEASPRRRVREHRTRLREQGMRPVHVWVPDVRSTGQHPRRSLRHGLGHGLPLDDRPHRRPVVSPGDPVASGQRAP